MLISHHYRFIFLHIYKTAGSAIAAALEPFAGHSVHELPYHITAREVQQEIGRSQYPLLNVNPKAWEEYFTFAVVRNPWDWILSLYSWLRMYPQHDLCQFARTLGCVNGFVRWLHDGIPVAPMTPHASRALYRRCQSEFVCDDHGTVIVDYIARLESLDQEFTMICDRLGVSARLNHTNRSVRSDYREAYNDESIQMVEQMFKPDIELFNYRFDSPDCHRAAPTRQFSTSPTGAN